MISNHHFATFINDIASPDRLLTAVIAVLMAGVVGLITGPLSGNANPYFWALFDRIVGGVARKAYIKDKPLSALLFRGTLFSVLFLIVSASFGVLIYFLAKHVKLNGMMEPLLLALLCTSGSVIVSVYRLFLALNRDQTSKEDKRGSFAPVAISARADLNAVDDFGIARIGAGFIAVAFDRGLVFPLFWYLIGGLPLACLVTGVTAAKWALAKNGFAKGYGAFVLGLEGLLGFLPRIISSALLIFAAVLTPHAGIARGISALFAFKNHARSAEGGLPLTIMAYALNVSLGGPVVDVEGSTIPQKFVGPKDASAKVNAGVLKQACYMGGMAHLLVLALLLALLMVMTATTAATMPVMPVPAIPAM